MAYIKGQFDVTQYVDSNGDPAATYIMKFFIWDTSTPTAVYSDSAGTSLGTSVTLNSLGQPQTVGGTAADIFFDTSVVYKAQLYLSDGTTTVGPEIGPFYPLGDGVKAEYDSFAEAYAGANTGIDIIITRSFYGGWAATTAGPKGGATYHRDGTTGTASTAYSNNSGFYDANGDGFKILVVGGVDPLQLGAYADNSTDDETALINAATLADVILSTGKTYYISNATLPDNTVIHLNGGELRGGIQPGDGAWIIGPGTISSNEGDARPLTLSSAKNAAFGKGIKYIYRGTTGVQAVVFGQPSSHTIENVIFDEPEIYCTSPTADANTRGFKILNQVVNTGSCKDIYVKNLRVHDTPSMGVEIVSEWGGFPSDYGDLTAYGHYNVVFDKPVIDNCGQTVGSQSKIGLSFAGTGQAKCIDPHFRNANGKNWEFVSQLGSEMIGAVIEDTASGFDVFSTSAPGGAPTAVNYKCKVKDMQVLDGNAQLLNVLGFEDGEISGIVATNVQRLEAGCYRSEIFGNRIEAAGNVAARVSGGENKIHNNTLDISAIGAGGSAALRFNGSASTDNIAWDNTLIHDSSVVAWDEQSSAADNLVRSYFDEDENVHDVNYVAFTMSADADENLSKQAEHANILRVTDAVALTATRKLTVTSGRNIDIKVWNATGSTQDITIGYSAGSVATIPDGSVIHIMGNGSSVWALS